MRKLLCIYADAFSGLPRDAWILSTTVLINRAGTMVVPFLTLWLTQQKGYSSDAAGLFLGAFGLGSFLGSLLGGWLADHIGVFRTQTLSLLASALGFIHLAVAAETLWIALAIFAVSIVTESFRPAHMSAMASVVGPALRTRALGLSRLAINLGMSIGPAVGGFLAEVDYRYLFWVDAATSLIAGVVIALVFRRRDATRPRVDDRSTAEEAKADSHVPGGRMVGSSPFADRTFLTFCALWGLAGAAFIQYFTTLPLYLSEYLHFDERSVGLVFSFNTIVIVAIEMPLLRKVEARNPAWLIAVGAILLCGGNALLLADFLPVPVSVLVALSVLVWTTGEMLLFPLASAWVANRAPEAAHGRYMGIFSIAFGISFAIGPVAGSYVYSHAGPDALWGALGLLSIVIGLGFARTLSATAPAATPNSC